MSTQEKELHTKFKLLLNGQGYVDGGVICISPGNLSEKKKFSSFKRLFSTHPLFSLFNRMQELRKTEL